MSCPPPPLALKDDIIVGASGGDQGVRDWIVSLDPKTGNVKWKTFAIPAPGEPGSETWKDKNNAWQTGGGAFYVTGSYDPQTNLTYWGSGNPVPGYDASYRPGDNLFTNSAIAFNVANGKMEWYFQYTPNDSRDYDETGTHILVDTKVNGEDRKILTHPGRNGFNYTFDRLNGQFLKAGQYVGKVTWTKGIDPKTGKPLDYDPGKDVQIYAEPANVNANKVTRRVCPDQSGGNNYWPSSYSAKTKMLYIPSVEGCSDITPDHSAHVKGKFAGGTYVNPERLTSSIVVVDPATGEQKSRKDLPYPNSAGVLTTAGGIVVTALARRHHRRARRPDARGTLEDQRRHRLQRAADDLLGRRQAIPRHRLGPVAERQEQADPFARDADGLAGDRDLGVRAVRKRTRRLTAATPSAVISGSNGREGGVPPFGRPGLTTKCKSPRQLEPHVALELSFGLPVGMGVVLALALLSQIARLQCRNADPVDGLATVLFDESAHHRRLALGGRMIGAVPAVAAESRGDEVAQRIGLIAPARGIARIADDPQPHERAAGIEQRGEHHRESVHLGAGILLDLGAEIVGLGPIFQLVVVAEIDLVAAIGLRTAAAEVTPTTKRGSGRTAV